MIFKYQTDPDTFNACFANDEAMEKRYGSYDNVQQIYSVCAKQSDGEPISNVWSSLILGVEFPQKSSCPSDFPSFVDNSSFPVVSANACKALSLLLLDTVEFLPVEFPDGEYYMMNVLNLVRCIDEEKSDVRWNRSNDRINLIRKHVFIPEAIQGLHIFRAPLVQGAGLYISEDFVQVCKDNNLTGLIYVPAR
ncbi:imm11 family protein [Calycomorphotria hydatis]|uniref:Immunity MXAN-0049 protein domain-containing protein n=1 Tax=Calycomorphotria hydatis TaxID=2528027 RepID=A0A517T9Y4_9PLAN|nr:DUF1629 domain-containing protein [Calycomorphotria hydatis]QDT65184.1 hypothetical protein V22_24310 [Calycomorphotria hydatis]